MDILPSYEEAITTPSWLQLVAPYVPASSWRPSCLVNSHFYDQFGPRLWLDPLITVRKLGLHPNDDLAWYRRFINQHVRSVRPSTRALVRSLDFRNFAIIASGLYSTEASERAISDSFKALPLIFPRLICLLVDGHPELDPSSFFQSTSGNATQSSLQLLDLGRCLYELTPKLLRSDRFRDLVYLDASYIPGTVKTVIQNSLNPKWLPELRVLKVQGREMDDPTAKLLFQTFRQQLWSLDISDNQLTDESMNILIGSCFSSVSFHSDRYFRVEGMLCSPREVGTFVYGPFDFVEESEHSASFDHPERYLADAPLYSRRADQAELQEWQVVRSDGLEVRKLDNAEDLKTMLLEDALDAMTNRGPPRYQHVHSSYVGLSHVHLSGNKFTSAAVERLLRVSNGRLELFECDSCEFWAPGIGIPMTLPQSLRVSGLFGAAHLFRPVYSSSLHSLRVHHSLVTGIPTLEADGMTTIQAWVLAETTFHERIKRAFPQSFMPDMNPRISSITLTGIPPRSVGPLIHELTTFLELALAQQQAMKDARAFFKSRGPTFLRGLRHIRLELEPDHSKDSPSMLPREDPDYDHLLDPASDDFSSPSLELASEPSWDVSSEKAGVAETHSNQKQSNILGLEVPREHFFARGDIEGEYVTRRIEAADSWTGNVFSVPVWIGTGIEGPDVAVNDYMANLRDHRLHTNVGPASPNHVAAGVPSGSYIFNAAWDSMVYPKQLNTPNSSTLAQLRDVATAIKEYRLRSRASGDFWTGKLELVRASSAVRYHSSEYWR